jgi:tRNA(fMet)-specific endonuclease VapC
MFQVAGCDRGVAREREVRMLHTNAVSALVKGRANGLVARLVHRPFCLSVITEAELRYGQVRRPVNADLPALVEGLLSTVDVRSWTTQAARRYGPLRAEQDAVGKPLGSLDLLIAAHALAEGCTLVTADPAFTNVPGLQIELPD